MLTSSPPSPVCCSKDGDSVHSGEEVGQQTTTGFPSEAKGGEKRKLMEAQSGSEGKRPRSVSEEDSGTWDVSRSSPCDSGEVSATSDYSSAGSGSDLERMVVNSGVKRSTRRQPSRKELATLLAKRERERWFLDLQYALLSDADGDRPLHVAVVQRDILLVQRLCTLMKAAGTGIDVLNCLRQTPLHIAVIVGNVAAVQLLLREGASLLLRDRHGNTALHLALKHFHEPCIKLLLRHKLISRIADVLDYDGYSPLHLAVLLNKPDVVGHLVKANCDINVPDGRSGRTPLYHAIALKRDHLVQQLVSLGASSEAQDYSGLTCIALAKESKSSCLPILQSQSSTACS
ncbi:B-cell lymphoma 3 protein-like [Ornithodoros turicata]|uniref:B-cell lymphoma 3 protein-like n=1 Tax=Ornithodoros turicata TaxID=34597 RepID=UPI003138E500